MFLKYSQCFVLLTVYSPILHHVVKPHESRKPNAYAYGWKCVDAAMEAVSIAEAMAERGVLYEAYSLTVDVVVMAATALLVVELGAPDNGMADRVQESSRKAKTLLETLARKNCAAARCLESLKVRLSSVQHQDKTVRGSASMSECTANLQQPLYESVARTTRSSTMTADQSSHDCNSSPETSSDIMVWEPPFDANNLIPELDPANFDMIVTNLLDDPFEPLLPSVEWAPGWEHVDYGNPVFAPVTMN
jgi:hypothetical protein